METTVLMNYVKLGWHIAGVNNRTKPNQKSVKLNRTKSIGRIVVRYGSVIEHNRTGTSSEPISEFDESNS